MFIFPYFVKRELGIKGLLYLFCFRYSKPATERHSMCTVWIKVGKATKGTIVKDGGAPPASAERWDIICSVARCLEWQLNHFTANVGKDSLQKWQLSLIVGILVIMGSRIVKTSLKTTSLKTHPEMPETHKKAAAQNKSQKACAVFIEPSSKSMFADVRCLTDKSAALSLNSRL